MASEPWPRPIGGRPAAREYVVAGPDYGVGFRIREMYAYLLVADDGDEAIPAITLPNGTVLPLIAADPTRLAEMRPHAEAIARATGKPIRLVRFTRREEVETINP